MIWFGVGGWFYLKGWLTGTWFIHIPRCPARATARDGNMCWAKSYVCACGGQLKTEGFGKLQRGMHRGIFSFKSSGTRTFTVKLTWSRAEEIFLTTTLFLLVTFKCSSKPWQNLNIRPGLPSTVPSALSKCPPSPIPCWPVLILPLTINTDNKKKF